MGKLNCRGIGVVIDDKVPLTDEESVDDAIGEIVSQLKADGISLLRFREIPQETEWNNFGTAAFLLIDWSLLSSVAEDSAKQAMKKRICDFIKMVHNKAFAPIFVFSNQDEGEIKEYLQSQGIPTERPDSYVLVKPKAEMRELDAAGNPKLIAEINDWIQATPAIKLFTSWGNDVLAARNQMFSEFYNKSHNWPSLLWKAYKEDDDDPSQGLSQVMFDNLRGRVKCNISAMPDVASDERTIVALTDVLSLTVMLPNNLLPSEQIGCGDLFPNGDQKFFLVVSCDCDCIIRAGESADNKLVQVVTIEDGCKRTSNVMKERFTQRYGLVHETNKSYIFPIDKKCYAVKYASHAMIKFTSLNVRERLGRILPPYITDIRQRLAQWNQRVGLPKLPSELFPAVESESENG